MISPKTEQRYSHLEVLFPKQNTWTMNPEVLFPIQNTSGFKVLVQLWVKTFSKYLIVPCHLFRKTWVVSELEISSWRCFELTFFDLCCPPPIFGSSLGLWLIQSYRIIVVKIKINVFIISSIIYVKPYMKISTKYFILKNVYILVQTPIC